MFPSISFLVVILRKVNKSDVGRYDRMLNFSDEQSKFKNYYVSLLLESCVQKIVCSATALI